MRYRVDNVFCLSVAEKVQRKAQGANAKPRRTAPMQNAECKIKGGEIDACPYKALLCNAGKTDGCGCLQLIKKPRLHCIV